MAKSTEDILEEIKEIVEERCDCVLSIVASSRCWRCTQLDFLYRDLYDRKHDIGD